MEKQFIGLKVEVILRDNTIVQGQMTNIDTIDRCLFLKNVYCKTTGKFIAEMRVEGTNIKDLNFISSCDTKKKKSSTFIDPAIISISDNLSDLTMQESLKKSKKDTLTSFSSHLHKKNKNRKPGSLRIKDSSNTCVYNMKNMHKKNKSYMNTMQKECLQFKHTNHDNWINEDVNRYHDEEFDFQGNLGRFDKHKVFSEIRKSNLISSTSVSVSSNCLSKTELSSDIPATNLVISKKRSLLNENSRFLKMNGDENIQSSDFPSSSHASSDSYDKKEVYQQKLKNQHSSNQQTLSSFDKISRKNKRIRNMKNNLECPCIKSSKMIEAEYISTFDTGISNDVIVENAARGISFLVTQLLDDFSRFSQKKNISSAIIILAGNNQTGIYAIASGRQLCNHGVKVMVAVPEENLNKRILSYLKGFSDAGGKIVSSEELFRAVKSFSVLPGLIIDAIFGCHCSFTDIIDDDLRNRICTLIDWANQYQSNILSLDLPSGLDIATGAPLVSSNFIQSKWIVSLGLPKTGLLFALKSKRVGKELFLADIGISQKVWKKVGIGKRVKSLWAGQDWVIKLEFS